MMSSRSLRERWDTLSGHSGGFLLLDGKHPLDLSVGFVGAGQRALLLLYKDEPKGIAPSKSIHVEINPRHDGLWAVLLTLIQAEQADVFVELCHDLYVYSLTAEDDALQAFISRYKKWHRLLEHSRQPLLSESQQRGLVGELCFIEDIVSKGEDIAKAIHAWVGPHGADQDFIFPTGWYEVKTIRGASHQVSISSLEQLSANPPGHLAIFTLDDTASTDPHGFTLPGKVGKVKGLAQGRADLLDELESKLARYGYIELREYQQRYYKLNRTEWYRVDSEFPKLTRDFVPRHLLEASYTISLISIGPWRIR